MVWRRRHYRVRRDTTPGSFFFSVLDNGVVSKEHWRILDAADDLSFALFYYAGAASTAGITYRGAILATPHGTWPGNGDPDVTLRIERALDLVGIKLWEMFFVDNETKGDLAPAPLQLPPTATTSSAVTRR
eukprot:Plantae.Rhodophyta-Rhodochaete_pulchella.ctg18163.p2 GENE.Plantae.Rhodophyta-Rhodochaete_pulchella.ctg18163~~Plantae.Rhodophyta-Rhodochaete_pulchella.ctg18163.p2  ORF type:complete len:131 (+),score=13.33 Plantae.Rhodophyta-Rhodochaete_pulchella.ctg18163:423-815(+)